ncbi:GH11690 [Drosophila grimshawi]|uniref:GH11690 n=2 Tax=Drosophila grimshawi TaxID=7222 RepID=B4JCZ5_DROGR|nr:GH11690 [Drosophila grimshawi]
MSQGAIAFLFIIFLPILGITGSKLLCIAHYTDLIFATFGCLFMGIMMDASRLSERLALIVIGICGSNLRVLQAGIMVVTSLSSIFVSSSFMSAFWMKVTQAIIAELGNAGVLVPNSDEEPYERQSRPYPSNPVVGIYLSIAYGATFGGMISLFQDPNADLYKFFQKFTDVKPGSFLMLFVGPFILGLVVTAIWINVIFLGLFSGSVKEQVQAAANGKDAVKRAMEDKKGALGPWNAYAILVFLMIIITMLLLFTRRPICWPGWYDYFHRSKCGLSVAIIAMCLLYFAVPANYFFCRYYWCRQPAKEGTAPSLVSWKIVNNNVPWAHVFMLCAGYGCLTGYKDSKLLQLVSNGIFNQKLDNSVSLIVGCLLGTLITNLAPAQGVVANTLDSMLNPRNGAGVIALPYAAALHNQFLLPVSTTSNTIVAGFGNVRPFQFLLGGVVPTLFMIIFICASIAIFGNIAFKGYLQT